MMYHKKRLLRQAFLRGRRRTPPVAYGDNPLSLLPLVAASSPEGGAFWNLPVSANKAPPERKDFPRPGEDVAQRQKGGAGTA